MRRKTTFGILGCLAAVCLGGLATGKPAAEKILTLHLRSQVETAKGSDRYHTLTRSVRWEGTKTAVVICDMWDRHWCPGATARVAEMAPRMNQVVAEARRRGALILHCPSDTMAFYEGTPQRRRAQQAPKVATKVPLQHSCRLDPAREGALPIDDSDGGCDSPARDYRAWTRQIADIHIEPEDAVTDSEEAYYLMRQRGIEHVLVMGVHTNMCVLARPFAIRQLVQQGLDVVLVRDMTDTMYNPAKAPSVSHFTGTDLVVDHIEQHWCPSITSADLVGGKEFRFKDDRRLTLVIVAAEDGYQTSRTLPQFALQQLGRDFRVRYVFADAKERHTLPGLDVLREADVLLLSVRRRGLPHEQMELLRQFIAAGKPVVGIRTASHAFAPKDKPGDGIDTWPTFDRDVLGCHYGGDHSGEKKTTVRIADGAASHSILKGVAGTFRTAGSLYRSQPLAEGATPLLLGKTEGVDLAEPVAWTWTRKDGGRVFCTSLGHPDDFRDENFVRLLHNGILWAAGLGKR
jgi:nicotinamidase-related amidase/type 1 glutamine amidotransferase